MVENLWCACQWTVSLKLLKVLPLLIQASLWKIMHSYLKSHHLHVIIDIFFPQKPKAVLYKDIFTFQTLYNNDLRFQNCKEFWLNYAECLRKHGITILKHNGHFMLLNYPVHVTYKPLLLGIGRISISTTWFKIAVMRSQIVLNF